MGQWVRPGWVWRARHSRTTCFAYVHFERYIYTLGSLHWGPALAKATVSKYYVLVPLLPVTFLVYSFEGMVVSLPQELIDETISCLPLNDKKTLRTCSLVARSWVYASQKRLFQSVSAPSKELGPWLGCISQKSSWLLRHVRHLNCMSERLGTAHTLYDHSRSLHRLSRITLSACRVSVNELVALVNCFLNLECLSLRRLPIPSTDSDKTPSLSRRHPLRKLYISEGYKGFSDDLGKLSEMGLRSDEVVFELNYILFRHSMTFFANPVIRAFRDARYVRLPGISNSMRNPYSHRMDPW